MAQTNRTIAREKGERANDCFQTSPWPFFPVPFRYRKKDNKEKKTTSHFFDPLLVDSCGASYFLFFSFRSDVLTCGSENEWHGEIGHHTIKQGRPKTVNIKDKRGTLQDRWFLFRSFFLSSTWLGLVEIAANMRVAMVSSGERRNKKQEEAQSVFQAITTPSSAIWFSFELIEEWDSEKVVGLEFLLSVLDMVL